MRPKLKDAAILRWKNGIKNVLHSASLKEQFYSCRRLIYHFKAAAPVLAGQHAGKMHHRDSHSRAIMSYQLFMAAERPQSVVIAG